MKILINTVTLLFVLGSMIMLGGCSTPTSLSEAEQHLANGWRFLDAGQWQAAIDECTKAIELYPDLTFAYAYRGYCYNMLAKYDLAMADENKAIQLSPNEELPYLYRGMVYMNKSNLDSSLLSNAISDFTKAIKLDPKDTSAYILRANAYIRQYEYSLAAADLNTVLKISKDSNDIAEASRMLDEVNQKQQEVGFVQNNGSSGSSDDLSNGTILSPARGLKGTWVGTGTVYTINIMGERASKVTARFVFTLEQSGNSVTGGYQIFPTSQQPLADIWTPLVSGSGQELSGTASITNLTLDAGGIVYGGRAGIEEWNFTFTTDTMIGGVTNLDQDSFTGLDSDPKAVTLTRQ